MRQIHHLRAFPSHVLLQGILCVFLIASSPSQNVPKTMTQISIRLIEPGPAPGSFEAQPKIYWRAGTTYARIAEAPDPENHIHGLMIIAEPDIWMVNLEDKSGKHLTDNGPSDVHMPIFPAGSGVKVKLRPISPVPSGAKMTLSELEFCMELEFFAKNGATLSAGDALKGKPTELHELTTEGRKLTLWTDSASKKPIRISMTQGTHTETYEYLSYQDDLAFDPSLFQVPAGIQLTDVSNK